MTGIILIFTLAIIVEALVEYGKSIGKAVLNGGWKIAVTQLVAMAVAVLLCFMTGGDLFVAVGIQFVWPWLGNFLTGIIISRGANYVSDFVKKLQVTKEEN